MLDKNSWRDLLSSAKKGNAIAQSDVGDYYAFGLISKTKEVIVRPNFFSAFSWYEKAATNGDVNALTNVADFLSEGKGCEKNVAKAIKTYLLAINKGSSRAALNLGALYRKEKKFKKAFQYYLLAEKMDNADYSFIVGLCYFFGIGISVNKEMACQYFQKVSIDKLQRHSQYEIDEANYLLGLAYLKGEGVRKSLKKARSFLQLANTDNDHRGAAELLLIIGQDKK